MVLLRRVIGDALRARRQGQHRTLREVSTAANVSLGYLSEIERGQKEASSELLAAICEALGARLSELLREVSDTLSLAEEMQGVLVPVEGAPAQERRSEAAVHQVATDGEVSVSVHQDTPLKATLRSTRTVNRGKRDVVYAA
jgi:transcriptional regulator with XRE-family HTH domain